MLLLLLVVACFSPAVGTWTLTFTAEGDNTCHEDPAWWSGVYALDVERGFARWTTLLRGRPRVGGKLDGRKFTEMVRGGWDGRKVGGRVGGRDDRTIRGQFLDEKHASGAVRIQRSCQGECQTVHPWPCESVLPFTAVFVTEERNPLVPP